jgi:hypothetical protein
MQNCNPAVLQYLQYLDLRALFSIIRNPRKISIKGLPPHGSGNKRSEKLTSELSLENKPTTTQCSFAVVPARAHQQLITEHCGGFPEIVIGVKSRTVVMWLPSAMLSWRLCGTNGVMLPISTSAGKVSFQVSKSVYELTRFTGHVSKHWPK